MSILADLKKYSKGGRLTVVLTGGAVISGNIQDADTAKLLLSNATIGDVTAQSGFSGNTVTIYLEHIIAHW